MCSNSVMLQHVHNSSKIKRRPLEKVCTSDTQEYPNFNSIL